MLPPLSNLDSTFEHQFAETLRYCKERIPFYQDMWRDLDPVARFTDIPTFNKADLRRRHADFLNRKLATRHILHTSGTTGDPLLILRSAEEVDFINDVFAALDREQPASSRRLGLSIRDNVHGFGPAYRGDTLWVGDPSFTPPTLALAEQYLLRRFNLPACEERITSIFMSLLEVLHFSEFVHRRGLDVARTEVNTVYTTGFPSCPTWNELIARRWRCRHVNVFSLAEVFGQALSCDKCGAYHWDPFSVVEFLQPDTLLPVENGLARLIITTLYPYTQLMPLARYDTGDLVVVNRECSSGPGFIPLGRRDNAQRLSDGTLLPFDSEILEALANCQWIKRIKPFSLEKLALPGTEALGMPEVGIRTSTSGSETVITLHPAEDAGPPSCEEVDNITVRLQGACQQSLSKAQKVGEEVNLRVEIGSIYGSSKPIFGCATAGIPQ